MRATITGNDLAAGSVAAALWYGYWQTRPDNEEKTVAGNLFYALTMGALAGVLFHVVDRKRA